MKRSVMLLDCIRLAQACIPVLSAPQNGTISCPGGQVTDQNCSFSCDYGFQFFGSEVRHCLWNNSWSGSQPHCSIKYCQELIKPKNGYIATEPCGNAFTTSCEIQCVEGYYINETTPFHQTCAVDMTTNEVNWTQAPTCLCKFLRIT